MGLRALAVFMDYMFKDDFQSVFLTHNIIVDYAESMVKTMEILTKKDYSLVMVCIDSADYIEGYKTMYETYKMPVLLFSYSYKESKYIMSSIQNGVQVFMVTPCSINCFVEMCMALANYYIHIKICSISNSSPALLAYNHLLLLTDAHQVFYKDHKILLTKKEFDLLHYFMMNTGNTLTYGQICDAIWREDDNEDINTLHGLVHRLRRKLRYKPGIKDFIEVVREVGYRFGYYNREKEA